MASLTCLFAFVPFLSPAAESRVTEDFDTNWLFSKGDFASAMMPAFDDGNWRKLNVPHDWSIEGPFSAEFSSGNGFVPGGVGWYRKHFQLDATQKNELVAIEFDGVYDNSEVWINGQFVGTRPFGFIGFEYDLTPYLNWNSDNVVAVRADHSRYADSRFYTGSGIYRNARLSITDPLQIAHWGASVTTPQIESDSALVRVETTIENNFSDQRKFSLQSDIVAPDGKIVGTLTAAKSAARNSVQTLVQEIKISQPQLWSLESPSLYTIKSLVKSGEAIVDETETPFGIRTATFDADKGFFLNGVSTKLKGVCIHHGKKKRKRGRSKRKKGSVNSIMLLLTSSFPIQQVRQICARAHSQSFRNPRQRNRRLPPQSFRHRRLAGIPLAPRRQGLVVPLPLP